MRESQAREPEARLNINLVCVCDWTMECSGGCVWRRVCVEGACGGVWRVYVRCVCVVCVACVVSMCVWCVCGEVLLRNSVHTIGKV